MGLNVGVDTEFTDSAGNQMAILATRVQDGNLRNQTG